MNDSLWIKSTNETNYPKLEKDISTDVCIVGAGINGISLAYMLLNNNLNVTVIDKDKICMGVTANTTGKITSEHGLFYNYLINSYGFEFAKKYLYSNEEALNFIKNTVEQENINCDFETQDSFVFTSSEVELEKIKAEVSAVNSLGFNASFCNNISLPVNCVGAIKFPNQAQFNARKYVLELANICSKNNVNIYENSKVIDIKQNGKLYDVFTNTNKIQAKYVVITSHYPIKNFPGLYFLKMYQSKSYILALDTKSNLFDGMYITSCEPITSFRTAMYNNKKLLLVAGSNHKTGDNSVKIEDSYINLENYIKTVYPNSEVKFKWSTEDTISLDKIPYIGEYSSLLPNMYVATGFKKWGITSSQVSAKIISDYILKKNNNYSDIYSSTRLNPIKNSKEFGNMLKQTTYSLIINKFSSPDELYENLSPESGGIVEYKNKKLGIYKRKDGKIFAVEPYCAHLGCELTWNNLEKTWDCPCHGSRFDYTGKIITEPTKKDLKVIDIYQEERRKSD